MSKSELSHVTDEIVGVSRSVGRGCRRCGGSHHRGGGMSQTALWKVYGADPPNYQCRSLQPDCYHGGPGAMVCDNASEAGGLECRLYTKEWQDLGNQFECMDSNGGSEDYCTPSGSHVCSQKRACKNEQSQIGEMYGEPIYENKCVVDENFPWIDVGTSADSISSNCSI